MCDDDDSIRPFEWLTSPASLTPILQQEVAKFPPSSSKQQGSNNNDAVLNVLHVGSGSSIWAEYLLNHAYFFPKIAAIVNVDKDEATLQSMRARWVKEQQRHGRRGDDHDSFLSTDKDEWNDELSFQRFHKLKFQCVDLVDQPIPHPDGSFDIVLDKSTLDCTLCSDKATAWLLHEVYRLLNPNGGVYILVSFHPLELLLPLLRDCPGTDWIVSYSVIRRQVEDLVKGSSTTMKQDSTSTSDHVGTSDSNGSNNNDTMEGTAGLDPTDRRKMVNVLVARRCSGDCGGGNSEAVINSNNNNKAGGLDVDAIYQHTHRTNDHWYKAQHPFLTPDRLREVRQAFAKHEDGSGPHHNVIKSCLPQRNENSSRTRTLWTTGRPFFACNKRIDSMTPMHWILLRRQLLLLRRKIS